MSSDNATARGPEKRRAVLEGAREVFGRDGYTRASIGAIAKAADVSTRTIYNHFQDKEELFRTVILESAEQVREVQLGDLDRNLGKIVDLESDLIALGLAFTTVMPRFSAHFALVRQIHAEVGHIPVDVLRAWQETGPEQVQADLAHRLAGLAEHGLLDVQDAKRAGGALGTGGGGAGGNPRYFGAVPLDDAEREEIVTAGVKTFLRAYRPQ
ncbi:TetR/AcrR family transcriptional regulator [Saccharopolyspora mangrovi]|uniref:TetR/AcrR family transcriptional regulator n=1 Tax=Saccharopolyspora mangrovi TaxID=3082379 RepID=A0ABU6ACK3_9PSEU|nr:TetR/AcrR family transcriptional regulator [Saccharopolyspora sp. S2-29]MEB3369060.1 TetR/AcrR family transcriptional regulator [Saccharopolyspora sp. S2-29]